MNLLIKVDGEWPDVLSYNIYLIFISHMIKYNILPNLTN